MSAITFYCYHLNPDQTWKSSVLPGPVLGRVGHRHKLRRSVLSFAAMITWPIFVRSWVMRWRSPREVCRTAGRNDCVEEV